MEEKGSYKITRLYDIAESQASVKELDQKAWQELRQKAQERVMQNLPRDLLGKYRDSEAKAAVSRQVLQVVENALPGMAYEVRQSIVNKLTNEISGYGPLEKYLDAPEITEIIVEGYDKVVVERNGVLEETDMKFESEAHLRLVIERIVAPLGRELNWASPTVDARLPDGSRVCAVIPPVSVDGAQLNIRKFRPNVAMDDLVKWGMLPPSLKEALAACIKGRLSVVVSGGTGSGKTTFLNALSEFIAPELSIITIENPVEMQLRHPRVRRWEARGANMEGKGEVSMMHLLVTALRARPDIIIVGEVRGKEAYVLINALNTGHDGSMTTLHANSANDAMKRLVSMVTSAGELASDLVPDYVADGVDLVVQLKRHADGRRRVTEVAEVVGAEAGSIKINPLVKFIVDGFEDDGRVKGHWEPTGNEFIRRPVLDERGVRFPGWGV